MTRDRRPLFPVLLGLLVWGMKVYLVVQAVRTWLH